SGAHVLAAAASLGLLVHTLTARVTPAFRTLLAAVLVLGALSGWLRARTEPRVTEQRTARYDAVVLDRSGDGDGVVRIEGLRVLARFPDPVPPIGANVVVRGRLVPFDGPRNPEEPSERALQRERGIDGRLESAAVLKTSVALRHAQGDTIGIWLAQAHAWAHEQLRARLGEPNASVLAGELWGERSALPPDLRAEFQETGTVHVLVTAGLHVGAVAALCLALLSAASLPRGVACALTALAIWAFALWSGAELPAIRAATMATAALTARACGRATFSYNALALAALAIVFVRPQSVATPSFALSFSCVAGIFTLAPLVERAVDRVAALPNAAREALVLSAATQLSTWPLSAAIFLQFGMYGLPANLAVVPCVAATMALGAAQLLLCWCAPLAQACANLNSWLLAWMLSAVRTLSSLPLASIPMTPAPPWCIAAYDAALLAAPALVKRRAHSAAGVAILLAAALVLRPPHLEDRRLAITVLDVGQADAIVVQTPAGHAWLVDTGGRLERGPQGNDSLAELVGERIVVPFLLRHGIHALDALIISHPHGDHVGGCAPVLRKIRVAEIADGGQTYGGHAYRDCFDTARERRVPIVYPRAGAEWRTGDGVVLRFLGPSLPFIANSHNDINENSVAFTLRFRSFCMLFTGDAGAAAEERFLARGTDLHCEILKVGHHGSAYSSTPAFIAAVHPRYAVISVGRHNLFGHPAPQTIETLRSYGATIYRTDQDGAATILSDGTTQPRIVTTIER
ncbi:MAG TPA: DNA internalization-related competence protein ComEC/Rec2, partial [Candidatus Baltobacteraceae bacterium]|nr:DNA internalization-related competence protein ComEC/Rec2 [Candidatus Baltobacteraceae bacterium]